MENKIHWRKITSNTSIKEKSDGQKADTRESIVLVACRLMVIAPPHLQNPRQKCSCLTQGEWQLQPNSDKPPGNGAAAGTVVLVSA